MHKVPIAKPHQNQTGYCLHRRESNRILIVAFYFLLAQRCQITNDFIYENGIHVEMLKKYDEIKLSLSENTKNMFSMDPWQYWLIIGIILFALETLIPGFVLACLGIGALLTVFIALLDVSLEGQLIAFSIISLLSFIGIRPFILRYLNKGTDLSTNVDSLIGKTAEVTKAFDAKLKKGRVKIDGDDWLAFTQTSIHLKKHELVKILKVASNTLIVTPLQNDEKN